MDVHWCSVYYCNTIQYSSSIVTRVIVTRVQYLGSTLHSFHATMMSKYQYLNIAIFGLHVACFAINIAIALPILQYRYSSTRVAACHWSIVSLFTVLLLFAAESSSQLAERQRRCFSLFIYCIAISIPTVAATHTGTCTGINSRYDYYHGSVEFAAENLALALPIAALCVNGSRTLAWVGIKQLESFHTIPIVGSVTAAQDTEPRGQTTKKMQLFLMKSSKITTWNETTQLRQEVVDSQ